VFVGREIGHKPFQQAVFLFYLPEPAEFAHAEMRILSFSHVKRLLGNAELAAEDAEESPALCLPKGIGDLLFGES
jgi:hypothetical protein